MKVNKTCALILFMYMIIMNPLFAGEKKAKKNAAPGGVKLSDHAAIILRGKEMSLGEAIRIAIEQNHDIITGSYDVAMADSQAQKYQTQYSPFLSFGGGSRYTKMPEDMSAAFYGTKRKEWDIAAAIAKKFPTGTTIAGGINHHRLDSDSSPDYGDPEYHRPIFFVSIQQELLKNSFGVNEQKMDKLLNNVTQMKRDGLIFQLSILVVGVIADYWGVVIRNFELNNARLQLKETKKVRKIIAQNVRLGLKEKLELNYYNALVAASEAKEIISKHAYRDSLRNFLRLVNLSEEIDMSGSAILSDRLITIDSERSLKTAYEKRADYRIALLSMENARLQMEIYENEAMPSMKAELNMSTMGQKDALFKSYSDRNPAIEARVSVTYPLDNRVQEVNLRNSRFNYKKAKIQVNKYKRQIKDEITSGAEKIETNYKLYNKTKKARAQAEIYFRRLYNSLRRGRFTAAVVKNGLDALIESRQRELGSLVLYNISILQFDIVKNELFEKYNIDIDKYIPRSKLTGKK